ncbi:MAG: uracil-DNA glycosylase, partial [Cyanobacteria bacterium REEB65]|nr:uracil-DNA glycosylase [Cyanobacteria bacterium REEB65]
MPADGTGTNSILIVGEAAGETEEREGKPFIGAAGFYLDRLLRRAGLDRDAFRVHNVLSCRPPGNKLLGAPYEHVAIRHCAPNLDGTIHDLKPKVIVALGGIPLRRLSGGVYTGITRLHNFVLPGPGGSWLIPLFHPSYLLPREGQANTSRFVGSVIWGLRRATRIAVEGFSRLPAHYLCDPPVDRASRFADEFLAAVAEGPGDGSAAPWLSWDIETAYKMAVGDEEELSKEEGDDDEDGEADRPAHDPILRISFA